MRWKTTLVLLIATMGLGAYVAYDLRQPSKEGLERLGKTVVDIPADTVTALSLKTSQLEASLKKHESGWLLDPQGFRANRSKIEHMLQLLSPLEADRVLMPTQEQPLDHTAIGLNPAIATITITDEKTSTTVSLGHQTLFDQKRYAKASTRPEVFIISSELFDEVNQPLTAFRDPQLFRLKTWEQTSSWGISHLLVKKPGYILELGQDVNFSNAWNLQQPSQDVTDYEAVTRLFGQLLGLTIAQYIEDHPTPEQEASWGLTQPYATIEGGFAGENIPLIITVGNPLPSTPETTPETLLRYVKHNQEPSVYAVASSALEQLFTAPDDLREKLPFKFLPNVAAGIAVETLDLKWKIEKVNDQWQESGTSASLDPQAVDGWLQKLTELRVVEFVDNAPPTLSQYGLEPPAATITMTTRAEISEASTETHKRLLVGSVIPGTTDRYGKIEGRATVVRLPTVITELVGATPASWHLPASPAPTSPETSVGASPSTVHSH